MSKIAEKKTKSLNKLEKSNSTFLYPVIYYSQNILSNVKQIFIIRGLDNFKKTIDRGTNFWRGNWLENSIFIFNI